MLQHRALNRIVRTTIILAVLLVCASGCGRGAEFAPQAAGSATANGQPTVEVPAIVGPTWMLFRYGPVDQPLALLAGSAVTAAFDPSGELRGSTGCAAYVAKFRLEGQSFAITALEQSDQGCPDDRLAAQAAAYVAALRSATSLTLTRDTLTIMYTDGVLRFAVGSPAPLAPLAWTRWQLVSFDTGTTSDPLAPRTQITAEFDQGTMRGTAGCNIYHAQYTMDGPTIAITRTTSTLMGCEAALLKQEDRYLEALISARSFQRDGDTLTITYAGGALHFTKQPPVADRPLEGPVWRLQTFVSGAVASSLIVGTEITAEFVHGEVRGSGGCSRYVARYTITGDTMTVTSPEVVAPQAACSMESDGQERTFLATLQTVKTIAIEGDRLTLVHANGELIFTARESTGAPASVNP